MKKNLILTLITLTLSAVLFTSCGSKAKGNLNLPPINIEPITDKTEMFDIEVDPRIELMGIICHLANYYKFSNPDYSNNKYFMTIDTMFGKYKDEPAVKTASKIGKRLLDDKFEIDLAYMIKPDFSGTNYDLNNPPEDFSIMIKKYNAAEIEKFIKQINDFAHKTNFEKFYEINRSEYKSQIALIIKAIEGEKEYKIKAEQWLKDFYQGYGFERAKITASLVTQGWSFYSTISGFDGIKEPKIVMTPYAYTYRIVAMISALKSYYLIDSYWNELEEPVKELYRKFKVKNNITNDIIEKLQVCWLLSDSFNTDFVLKCWNENEKQSLIDSCIKNYLFEEFPLLVKIVDEYVSNSEKYPCFENIYPEYKKLIESL